jgi:cobalamin biosynthetic protein CobC
MREQRLPEHGGDLDQALRRYGGCAQDWIDLSTGINRQPYPVVDLPFGCWTGLPSRSEIEALHDAARQAYGTEAPVLATAGAQAAIGLLPYLSPRGRARILAPTYNEYAAVLSGAGFDVVETDELETLAGADLAVVANPNNPDGRHYEAEHLLALLPRVGRLVVDESFADATCGLSLMPRAGQARLVILRSFGKFYGLAGLRLGFIAGSNADIARLAAMAGPWPVSGAAIAIGKRALLDHEWAKATSARLARDCVRLDRLAASHGWILVGGTALFRLYETGDSALAQERLGRARIWSRTFPQKPGWLRLGLPGNENEWERLTLALKP